MNFLLKFIVLLIALAIGNVIYKFNLKDPVEIPPNTWWGVGDPKKEDRSIKPFQINVPNKVLEDLQYRLKNARPFTPPLEGIQQQYGLNTKVLKEVVEFWIQKYNWREREVFLNQYPQFTTYIQGLQIHFLHVKPKNVPAHVKVLPLLVLHGWPGSIREFYELIPHLITPKKGTNFVFELVIPSLPGYGFSKAATKPGLGVGQIAVIFKNLMDRLGYEEYYVQGGDWGSSIVTDMAIFYPDIVKGMHVAMCHSNSVLSKVKLFLGSFWPSWIVGEKQAHRLYPVSEYFANIVLEFGYMHLQATKPDTIGVGLNDSPVGLAAYFLEKFSTWTNPEYKNRNDAGLQDRFTYTKLLDNIMIYWVTNSITTSMRLYSESLNKKQNVLSSAGHAIGVPTACAVFDNEIIYQSRALFEERYPKLVQANELDGGHFAAFEVPATLANDVWLAVSKFEDLNKSKKP